MDTTKLKVYQQRNRRMTIFDLTPTCFYHPIKTIFLDDNRAFLDALELEFSTYINMLTFTNPDAALRAIDSNSEDVTRSILKLVNNVNADTTTDRIVGFEINKILNLIYDRTRFDNAAVLVVDYEMPDINGIEFCQKLKGRNIFKIMLTAEADKDTAITAFNDGIIDKFILKTSKNLYQELTSAVCELTHRYFKESSRVIMSSYNSLVMSLFKNEPYQNLFNQTLSETNAVEYYMVDNSGSFLFFDKDAVPTWLIVRHGKELQEQLELLQGYDIPDLILSSISKREKILFLPSENEYKKPIAEWVNYMFEAKQLDNDYYFSIVNDRITHSIKWDEVSPYAKLKLAEAVNA
jgi:CheY-like chemotaxis protein